MKIAFGILGQSNEAGPGPSGDKSRSAGAGAPAVDPIGPVGSNNSPWPHLAKAAGARGHWYAFRNHGIGSTNLCDYWVGRCRAYAVSMVVAPGSYVLDGGNVYKAVQATPSAYVLNVAPSAGVGTSGLTSWTNLGAATAADTDGAIYTEGSARFDPNGKIAALYADLANLSGFDRKAVIVSIGQTDKTLSSTRAEYGAAMQSVANYFTTRSIYVFLGFTIYSDATGMDAWYTSQLMPGRLDALAALSSNALVFPGYNAREELGELERDPPSGRGLQSDGLHGNADCMLDWGRGFDAQLESIGW